jgi:fructokinase
MKTESQETPPRPPAAAAAPIVVGLGELIWDYLPGGKQLGGAPANFAYISRLLGNASVVASRIGDDALGREAKARLTRLDISTEYLQSDAQHPTGTVRVRLDEQGEAIFAVNENSAWDYLEWTDVWKELARKADVVCFGTLGQRAASARETVIQFLEATRPLALRVFDVNLRHSFFNVEMLERSLELATVVKLNQAELSTLGEMLRLRTKTEAETARRLLEEFALELIAITRGRQGSLLVTATEASAHPGIRVGVRDTIGAGDAFIAALAHYYLRRAPLALIGEAANRMGAWVVTQDGATPFAGAQVLEELLSGIC